MFQNLITGQMFPTKPAAVMTTQTLLSTLGQTIDTDFLFLLPESDSDDPKYKLEAYICICPSGWDPRAKLGQRLASIHDPVPGYKEKLEGSMDRYFKSLDVGKYVKRSNWSITQHEELFMPDPDTNHGHVGKEEPAIREIDPDKVGKWSSDAQKLTEVDLFAMRETDSSTVAKIESSRLLLQNVYGFNPRSQA